MEKMLEKLKGGLIVSCYAGPDFNAEMGVPQTMVCVAKSCIAGGACAIRTNWGSKDYCRKQIEHIQQCHSAIPLSFLTSPISLPQQFFPSSMKSLT